VYLHAYSDGWEAEIRLARFLWRYCHVMHGHTAPWV
jgi:putative transposase